MIYDQQPWRALLRGHQGFGISLALLAALFMVALVGAVTVGTLCGDLLPPASRVKVPWTRAASLPRASAPSIPLDVLPYQAFREQEHEWHRFLDELRSAVGHDYRATDYPLLYAATVRGALPLRLRPQARLACALALDGTALWYAQCPMTHFEYQGWAVPAPPGPALLVVFGDLRL